MFVFACFKLHWYSIRQEKDLDEGCEMDDARMIM